MNARDELAQIWANAYEREIPVIDAILAAGYRKTYMITTAEEVDALPERAIVMTCFGDAVTIYRDNPGLPAGHYHFLISDGTSATVLHIPDAPGE